MENTLDASDSKASVAQNTRNAGKSSHVAALRSLGLLHDLQEYVATLQQTAAEQEKELNRLKGEKQEADRVLKKALHSPDRQPYVQHFQASEIADLPPRLRALFEDNKVLKEEVRRYKGRTRDAERTAAQQEQQLTSLTEQVKKLKRQVAEGAASPEALAAEEQARQQADAATRALEKLQDAHRVLQQKLETDARSHKQAIATAAKERHQLEKQIDELQQQLDAKDKEARAAALAAKKAERRLHEVKTAAAEAVAGVNTAVAKAVAAEKARQRQVEDASVHLMLCFIRDTGTSSAGQQQRQQQQQQQVPHQTARDIWSEPSSSSAAAVAAASDHSSSRADASYSREDAVLIIQAGARGFLTRKKLRAEQQQDEHAAVLIQAGGKKSREQQQSWDDAQQPEQQHQQQSSNQFTDDAGDANLPMDLPALATVDSRAIPAAQPAAAAASGSGSRAGSTMQKRNSSMGGPSGPRIKTSAPQYGKSASQSPKPFRQAGSASPRLISNTSRTGSSRSGGSRAGNSVPTSAAGKGTVPS